MKRLSFPCKTSCISIKKTKSTSISVVKLFIVCLYKALSYLLPYFFLGHVLGVESFYPTFQGDSDPAWSQIQATPLRHSPLWRRGGSTQLCRVCSVLSSPPLSLSDYCRALYNTTPRISGLPGFSFVFCSPHDVFQRQTVSRFEPMLLSLPVRCAHACT